MSGTLRGMTTVSYWAEDPVAAKDWYAELLGVQPYFEVDGGYFEFRLGDHQQELGIIDRRFATVEPPSGPAGIVLYWHVDDVNAVYDRLLSMGATEHEAPRDRGDGFVTASVLDPFGNLLGVMYNPHYLDVLKART